MTKPRFVLVDEDDGSPAVLPDGTVLDGEVAERYAQEVIARVREKASRKGAE